MFYTFDQNNSGGEFVVNDQVAHYVIIEAASAKEANEIAESKGIYFNGCKEGNDCPCCGDRWCSAYEEGDKSPLIYGQPPEKYKNMFAKKGQVYCYVYWKSGKVSTFKQK